jgi:hypothetical protein
MLDGFAYPSARFHLVGLWRKARDPGAWRRLIARAWRRGPHAARADAVAADVDAFAGAPQYVRAFPPEVDFARGLRSLGGRGVFTLCAFSGGIPRYHNHRAQFPAWLARHGLGGQVDCAHFPQANHTYTEIGERRRLIEAIVAWTLRRFPARAIGAAPAASTARASV